MKTLNALLAVLCVLCPPAGAHAAKLRVVASFSILGDMVREVAGDAVTLDTLVGPDGDAHVFEPTPADAKKVADAGLVFVNGLGFEGWLDRLVQSSGYRGPVVVASAGVAPLTVGDGTPDPHAWQDVADAKIYVANIRDALMKADPAHAALYQANAARYLLRLDALDSWVRAQIAEVPSEKRRAISSHNALHYFARAYGVQFVAPLGLSTSGDASAATIAQLVDQIRRSHVRAVFIENMSDPRLMQQLVRDGGAVIGGTIYSDALSQPSGPAPDYVSLIRHNTRLIAEAMKLNN